MRFKRSDHLSKHVKTVHSETRSVQTAECSKDAVETLMSSLSASIIITKCFDNHPISFVVSILYNTIQLFLTK